MKLERPVILILEDNDERIAAFEATVAGIADDLELVLWRDAPTMIRECEQYFDRVVLFSLDHDLNPQPGATEDPGTGLDVTNHLVNFPPICPVVIHSTNVDRVWSMHNEFRFAGWEIDRIGPFDGNWIQKSWCKLVDPLIGRRENLWVERRKPNHDERMKRAFVSLHGLAIGDAVGEMFAYRHERAWKKIVNDELPSGPWFHTDDTEMAISIVETLLHHGCMEQSALARRFALRYEKDPDRGYGKGTRIQLRNILRGQRWQTAANDAFSGDGSLGNGGAMRVAPLGAFYAGEFDEAAGEAAKSSAVTHTHPEGIAGTIAVSVAASVAASGGSGEKMFKEVLQRTPVGKVHAGIERAASIELTADQLAVGTILGNGSMITAADTVPFTLWCAARHWGEFATAIASGICTGGDCDTNAAIIGGIVAANPGVEIEPDWLSAMEEISFK